jgi:hypothetical protein
MLECLMLSTLGKRRDHKMQKSYRWALVGILLGAAGTIRPAAAAPPATVPARVQAFPGPGAVLITFTSALNASGYNVYRRDVGQTPAQATKVNAAATPYTWVIDDGGGQGLTNGKPLLYFVKAVLSGGAEADASADVVVTPQMPILGGLFVHEIGTTDPTSVTIESGILTVKAAGYELWNRDDSGAFIGTAVSGDYSVSVKMTEKPTGGHPASGKAGVMIREGLLPGDRYAILVAMTGRGVYFEGRPSPSGAAADGTENNFAEQGTLPDDTTYPLWLKLTKAGAVFSAFQSNDGTTYQQVGSDQDYGRIQAITHAGLGFSAVNVNDPAAAEKYLTARFDAASFKIE